MRHGVEHWRRNRRTVAWRHLLAAQRLLAGGVVEPASIISGRWKALHYYMRAASLPAHGDGKGGRD